MTNHLKALSVGGVPVLPFDPATINEATERDEFELGAEYWYQGKGYTYVQFKDVGTVAIAVGTVCQPKAGGAGLVTADISASLSSTANRPTGIALATMTADYYGFVQSRGICTTITTDGNVAAGNFLVSGADGVADPFAAAADATGSVNGQAGRIFGQALEADASTTLSLAKLWCS